MCVLWFVCVMFVVLCVWLFCYCICNVVLYCLFCCDICVYWVMWMMVVYVVYCCLGMDRI